MKLLLCLLCFAALLWAPSAGQISGCLIYSGNVCTACNAGLKFNPTPTAIGQCACNNKSIIDVNSSTGDISCLKSTRFTTGCTQMIDNICTTCQAPSFKLTSSNLCACAAGYLQFPSGNIIPSKIKTKFPNLIPSLPVLYCVDKNLVPTNCSIAIPTAKPMCISCESGFLPDNLPAMKCYVYNGAISKCKFESANNVCSAC